MNFLSRINIGTSGYSYKDWVGPIYPPGTRSSDYLHFYTQLFKTVEINSTYYRLFEPAFCESLAKRTPHDFRFTVKAFKEITHERTSDLISVSRKFIDSIKPLSYADKLGAVLLQFPWSFKPTRENRIYLQRLGECFRDLNPVVELRNSNWIGDNLFKLLEDMKLGFCVVDEPRLDGLMPPIVARTSPIGYIRFHGRNAEKWWNHDAPHERYDYLYSKEELTGWLPAIQELLERVENLYIFTNNHYKGQAVKNASMLHELIGLERPGSSEPSQERLF